MVPIVLPSLNNMLYGMPLNRKLPVMIMLFTLLSDNGCLRHTLTFCLVSIPPSSEPDDEI